MTRSDLVISRAADEDLAAVAAFMTRFGGRPVSAEYLRHWYMRNPSGSATVMTGRINGRIAGLATTNDHYFTGPEGHVLFAMPQKVLTDPEFRGLGIFGRLYRASEAAGREHGITRFLTVTNAASTPIFLEKFGYQRAPVPRIIAMPSSPGSTGRPAGAREWPAPSSVPETAGSWRMSKDRDHYRWRYSGGQNASHTHLSVQLKGEYLGELFLKKIRRKGLPVMLLLDVLPVDDDRLATLIGCARAHAWRMGCLALLALATAPVKKATSRMIGISISSGFNLLVKGSDPGHTAKLAGMEYELAFGDLDFL
jgi:GNAT superfamily N-acetyltransferase